MKDIDWSKAPEGATHWVGSMREEPMNPWEKHTDGKRYIWIGKKGRWDEANMYSLKIYDVVIERPTPWQGPQDGLPPDGTECEISNCGSDFEWCLIKYMGSHLCVVDHKTHHDQHYHLGSVKFRPIQSGRNKAIRSACNVLRGEYIESELVDIAGQLFDAGMLVDPERKPMSRAAAWDKIMETPECEPIRRRHAHIILDALGYKE